MAVTEPAAAGPRETQGRFARVPLAARVFVPALVAIVPVLAAAILAIGVLGERNAGRGASAALDATVDAQSASLDAAFQALAHASGALARDDGLDEASTPGQLRAAIERAGFDRAIVLDAGGVSLVDSLVAGDAADAGPLADDPLVAAAIAAAAPASGFWLEGRRLYLAAIAPLAGDGRGFLLLARRVDDAFARALAPRPDSGVAFWVPGEDGPVLVAGSIGAAGTDALQRLARETPALVDALQLGQPTQRLAIEIAGAPWLLQPVPTVAGRRPALAAVASVTALVAADTGSGYPRAMQLVVLAALAALALAMLLSLWLARAVRAPLARLEDATARALAGSDGAPGDAPYDATTAPLATLVDALLRRMRERHALQAYVARYLPDACGPEQAGTPPRQPATPTIEPARRSLLVLLAVEVPQAETANVSGTMAAAGALSERLAGVAQQCGGRLVAGDGERWALVFEGDRRMANGLDAALQVAQGLEGEATPPAMAMADGEMVSGSVAAGEGRWPALLGGPGRQLVRLLCESAPGTTLVARPLGERIRQQLGHHLLTVAAGSLGGRRYYALDMPALAASSPPPPTSDTAQAGAESPPPREAAAPPSASVPLRVGEQVGGRYEVLAPARPGPAGMAYPARDRETGARVDIALPGARAWQGGWARQAAAARGIEHPNVQRVLDTGQFDGRAYVVLEHAPGATLRSLLDRSGPVPYLAGLCIARQLVDGVAAVHAAGLVHGDIRPESLSVDGAGNARLAGIGTGIGAGGARTAADAVLPVMALEPAGHSAPECLAGDALDARADVYSCGALFSEMFCGGVPYEGSNATEVYLAQVRQEPRRPSELWPEVPPALERIILRCIARRREDRFQTAAELASALAGLRG